MNVNEKREREWSNKRCIIYKMDRDIMMTVGVSERNADQGVRYHLVGSVRQSKIRKYKYLINIWFKTMSKLINQSKII